MDPQNRVQLVWGKGYLALSRGLVHGSDDAFGPTGDLQKSHREAAEISDAIDTGYARAALGAQAVDRAMMGEYEDAIVRASRGLETARSLGDAQLATSSLLGLGDAYRETFALEKARSAYSELFDWISFTTLERHLHAKLCAVAALSGDWKHAHEHAHEALGFEEELFLSLAYLHLHHDVEALLRGGDEKRARETLRLLERRTVKQRGYFRLAYVRSGAVLTRWEGDKDRTLALLYEALRAAERLGLPGEIWQIAATLGELHEEREEIGSSERAFDRSAAVIRHLAANMEDEDLREGYLAAPQTSRVLEKARDQDGPGECHPYSYAW